ncbi:hypothetical protein C8F04DRAFT_1195792 [Mycena alexandri]|uniref:Chromo domain-containing protein n=1 Tax=Mycena alexandri TaxID=1745969 RepID=A0AAD6WRQ6_9AGAR|nr:hypothetical protein C8F04DRAFT_1195792 [Mycena alexandri]
MSNLDWSQTDALRDFKPEIIFRPSQVRDTRTFGRPLWPSHICYEPKSLTAAEVEQRTLFGHPKNVEPIRPEPLEYVFTTEELSCAPRPTEDVLIPPPLGPDDPPPPNRFLFPKAGVFTLKKTSAYQRGYVYTTPYYLASKPLDHHRMLRVVAPPQLSPTVVNGEYVHHSVPECVQMVPGVPFAFEIDGHPDELHTIGAVHTFESLRHEPEFDEILENTILVAKGLRGCRPVGNTDEIFPITAFNIKTNDRSPANVPAGSNAGSYNLASTLLKGNGPGIVLPAAQVDTPEFTAQITTLLRCLGVLRRLLLRKTLSKFEYEATEFNSEDMNVVGFGGLEANNATSCQLNLSPIWQLLSNALGLQGSPHPDVKDEETRKTYFLLLLSLPPGSDAGAFLLARAGIYIRELNTWAIHIFFDGTDIHTGIGATTTLSIPDFKHWVDTELETAWKVSELGRMGIVQYATRSAHNRDTYISMMPAGRFGNIVPEPATSVRDYANHAEGILGGREAWANRMGREIIFNFWNQLQVCNLDLGKDIGDILQSVTFKNYNGQQVALQPLPFHPLRDAASIALKRSHFEYLRQRCSQLRIYISKHHFLQFRERLRQEDYDPTEDRDALYVEWQARTSISARSMSGMEAPPNTDFHGKVVKILEPVRLDGQIWYRVLTDDDNDDDAETPAPLCPAKRPQRSRALKPFQVTRAHAQPISGCGTAEEVSISPILDLQKPSLRAPANPLQMEDHSLPSPVSGTDPAGGGTSATDPPISSLTTADSSPTHPSTVLTLAIPTHSTAQQAQVPDTSNSGSPASIVSVPSTSSSAGCGDAAIPSDDSEYDVEKIINVRQEKRGKSYLCKLVGYDTPDWIFEHDLSTECDRLLAQFYESLATASEEEEKDSDSDSDPDSERPKKKRPKLTTKGKSKQRPKAPAPIARLEKIALEKTQHLESLLNVDRLTIEVAQLQAQRPTKGAATRLFFRALGAQTPILDIVDTCYIQNRTLSALDMVVDNDRSTTVEIAAAQFLKLAASAQTIPQFSAFERVTAFLSRILRWTNARAHIVIYRWCSSIGPATIKTLFELHRERGYPALVSNQAMALLVDHIVQYVCQAKKNLQENQQSKRRRVSAPASPTKHGAFGPTPPDLSHLPGDLYGIVRKGDKKHLPSISLAEPGGLVFNLYAACEWCLMDVFQRVLILPAVRQCADLYTIPNKGTRKNNDDGAFSRAICRGAVLDCILNACGDDGILSSNAIDDVTRSPWLSFTVNRPDRLGPALLNRANITLEPLESWLSDHIGKHANVLPVGKSLGDEIHTVLEEMAAGEPHPDTVASVEAIPEHATPKRPAAKVHKRRIVVRKDLQLNAILPDDTIPRFGLPALIIREALNLHRGLAPGDSRLRRLLLGGRAIMSTALRAVERNPDHLDPRREFNHYTTLFKMHCPPQRLTGPAGLSNALAWFGTGQGFRTQRFLDSLLPNGGFFKTTLSAMTQQFENAISQNAMTADPMKYDDESAWSQQPNNHLSAQPTKKRKVHQRRVVGGKRKRKGNQASRAVQPPELYSLSEKFGPDFEISIQTRWTGHLGSAAGLDPDGLNPEDLPCWSATLQLVSDLHIPPFTKGLTAMQLVNTLAFCGVVKQPTVQEMATWISKNRDLGAVAGLKLLGFQTNTPDHIHASYVCFHNYLEAKLTTEDQTDLGFHPPFTEHVLCKTPRWDRLLGEDGSTTLVQMATDLGNPAWTPGENRSTPAAIPFPLAPERGDLEVALELKLSPFDEVRSWGHGGDSEITFLCRWMSTTRT